MKTLFLIPIVCLFNFMQVDTKLNGKYKVTSKHNQEEYVIVFSDSIYKKVFQNGKEIKGVVKYGNLIYLIDYESSLKTVGQKTIMVQTEKLMEDEQMTLRSAGKGKFSFCFSKRRKDGPMNWLDICHNTGEMVKVE